MEKINFVFFGTPEVSSKTLEILKIHGLVPNLIITGQDKKVGRKMILTPNPVKNWAIENNIKYLQPEKITKDIFNQDFDFALVVAFGKILPEEILDMPKFGSLNIHYSLLPKYRGASPVESAILNKEKETGVSIQKMKYKMDSGPIVALEKTEILENDTTLELREKLIKIGAELFCKILPDYLSQKINSVSQDESLATFCKKIKKEDGQINLDDEPENIFAKFKAFKIWPRIFFFENGKRVVISDLSFEDKTLKIKKVIPEGKKEISYEEFTKNYTLKSVR